MSASKSGQSGFTLIELLISIVIGMTVSAIAAIFLGAVMSSRDQVGGNVELQEANYFVSQTLRQLLVQAGYRALEPGMGSAARNFPFPDANAYFTSVQNEWAEGQYVKATDESLSIRFGGESLADGTADNSIYDCLGIPVTRDEQIEVTISFLNSELICTSGDDNEILIGGDSGLLVENMNILIGVDDDGDRSADRYTPSSSTSTAEFMSAVAFEIRLLLASDDNVLNYSESFQFSGDTFTSTDLRARRETVVMVALRN